MSPAIRLRLIAVVLILSSLYAILVAYDRVLASTVSLGYIAIVLTILTLCHYWRKS